MKRVICLYRVSTLGQVDHDDIPMQRKACHEYVETHPDWEIVDEISEKGVSGYKVKTNDRDAIMEIKRRAVEKKFDVLLVFMFDRLGRRDDETPFVVQWFVQQGIEVWSTREGEQRFETHVDKLMNYIRFWQASGESEKTAIRVKTKHSQMVQDGQYRGGLVPYGYRLEHLGRMNKRDKPVPDLVIDEDEANVVKIMFHLIVDEGYGTHRLANWLNERNIKTKRGTSLWRDTSIRALLSNPVYIGILRFGDERSKPFPNLAILDEQTFNTCQALVHQRAPSHAKTRDVPLRTDARGLLSGLLFCKECGSRLSFNHNTTKKHLADGRIRVYERDQYRCYRRMNSKRSCNGATSYLCDKLNDAVKQDVRRFFERLKSLPQASLFEASIERKRNVAELAYDRARTTHEGIQQTLENLYEQALAATSGKAGLSLEVINTLILKCQVQEQEAKKALDEAKARMDDELAMTQHTAESTKELLTWADCFDQVNMETQHMILTTLIDRIEVGRGYKLTIHYKVTPEQFFGEALPRESCA